MNGEIAPAAGEMRFHIPLVKIDVERRLVIGRAAQEVIDKSNEIMDYASAKPQFEKWSNSFSSATNGLSKGNLRVMHTKHVAGKIQDLSFDDNDKSIHVMAYVSDDNDWKKCLDGSYTGFSMGGGYLKKWNDNGVTRYTPDIRELSLVDSPCIPTARFAELVKADGVVEQIRLRGRVALFDDLFKADAASFDQMWKGRPVLFDDMTKNSVQSTVPTAHPHVLRKIGRSVLEGTAGAVAGSFLGGRYRRPAALIGQQLGVAHGLYASYANQAKAAGYRHYGRAGRRAAFATLAGSAALPLAGTFALPHMVGFGDHNKGPGKIGKSDSVLFDEMMKDAAAAFGGANAAMRGTMFGNKKNRRSK